MKLATTESKHPDSCWEALGSRAECMSPSHPIPGDWLPANSQQSLDEPAWGGAAPRARPRGPEHPGCCRLAGREQRPRAQYDPRDGRKNTAREGFPSPPSTL